ncbi:MAG TPA: hypothetical protein VGE02_13860 [Gemmatimonadales bacterium]
MRATPAAIAAVAAAGMVACGPAASPSPAPSPDGAAVGVGPGVPPWVADSLDPSLVPAGHGTLRQEDVAIRLPYQGLVVRILPLDESVIRVLSPDAYQALRELQASRREEVERVARRYALSRPRLWYVSFHGVEQGETRYSPLELQVTSTGRDFRPVDAIPLTPGFGEQRLAQREMQAALYVFDDALDARQPFTISFQGVESAAWEGTLRRIEREHSLIRSRAARPRSS